MYHLGIGDKEREAAGRIGRTRSIGPVAQFAHSFSQLYI